MHTQPVNQAAMYNLLVIASTDGYGAISGL